MELPEEKCACLREEYERCVTLFDNSSWYNFTAFSIKSLNLIGSPSVVFSLIYNDAHRRILGHAIDNYVKFVIPAFLI